MNLKVGQLPELEFRQEDSDGGTLNCIHCIRGNRGPVYSKKALRRIEGARYEINEVRILIRKSIMPTNWTLKFKPIVNLQWSSLTLHLPHSLRTQNKWIYPTIINCISKLKTFRLQVTLLTLSIRMLGLPSMIVAGVLHQFLIPTMLSS